MSGKFDLVVFVIFIILWFCGGGMTRNDTTTSPMSNILLFICFAYILMISIKYFWNKLKK